MSRVPGSPLKKPTSTLVAEANVVAPPLSLEEAHALLDDDGVLFVDVREPQEWAREGIIPGAYRASRGLLEFWVDPESPYYRPALDDGRKLVLYCGSAWRSALAARSLTEMGLENVTHIEGGFDAWRGAGLPVQGYEPRA